MQSYGKKDKIGLFSFVLYIFASKNKTMMINILNYNKSVIKCEKNNNCEVCSNDCK